MDIAFVSRDVRDDHSAVCFFFGVRIGRVLAARIIHKMHILYADWNIDTRWSGIIAKPQSNTTLFFRDFFQLNFVSV